MSHEPRTRRSLPEPAIETPDLGFKAGFGFYLGLIVAGITALVGILAGTSTEVILATTPGTVTAVLLGVLIVGDRLRGVPEWLGRSRRRRLACYAPVSAFVALAAVPSVSSLEYSVAFGFVAVAFVILTSALSAGVARMARNRYVGAITGDEPITDWTWQRTGLGFGMGERGWAVLMAGLVVFGLGVAWTWGWFSGVIIAATGLSFLFGFWTDSYDESDGQWGLATFHAYEAGLVLEQSAAKKLVPWDAIEDVRLTDDALVLERRWRDIRCDRAAIEDPDAVLDGIQRARGHVSARTL